MSRAPAGPRVAMLLLAGGLSQPAVAHGGGLLLIMVGLPLLLGLYGALLGRALFFVPRARRRAVTGRTLLLAPVWALLAGGPLMDYRLEMVLREFEGGWSLGVPLLLAAVTWHLQNRIIRAPRPRGK